MRKLTRESSEWLIKGRGEYPYPKKPGASHKPINDEERECVIRARDIKMPPLRIV
ncbi:MAG: hypothetical protein QXH42_04380 [Thermoplasmata archaeon]